MEEVPRDLFPFVKTFSKFPHKIFIIILHDIITKVHNVFQPVLIQNYNVYFSPVCFILFSLVLHLNCTALNQSEQSYFFICIIMSVRLTHNMFHMPIVTNMLKIQRLTF